jgi:hypothetical protein
MSQRSFLPVLLRPFARFFLRRGVVLSEGIDSLKHALLEAGAELLEKNGEALTASRLSVMTGVHRKDCAAFLKGSKPQRDGTSFLIHVIGAWQSKKKFKDKDGALRSLTCGNERSEFAELVRSCGSDVHPATVLRELERLGIVSIQDAIVTLLKKGFVTTVNDEQSAGLVARDIDDLLLCAEENITASGVKPNHHTTTSYDNIPVEYQATLQAWIQKEAATFHERIRQHVASYDRDLTEQTLTDKNQGTVRFVFGSFARVKLIDKQQKEKDQGDTHEAS